MRACTMCPCDCTYSVYCKCSVLCAPPMCKCIALCTALTLQGANCAAGARRARVECTANASHVPALPCCAEKLPKIQYFHKFCTQQMPPWLIAVLKNCEFHQFLKTEMSSEPVTTLVLRNAKKHGDCRTYFDVDEKWCVHGWFGHHLVPKWNGTLAEDPNCYDRRFAQPVPLGSFSYVQSTKCTASVTSSTSSRRHQCYYCTYCTFSIVYMRINCAQL